MKHIGYLKKNNNNKQFVIFSIGLARKGPVRGLEKRVPNRQMENVLISPENKLHHL